MQWTFPDLDRRYNKNLYIVAYRDITDLKLDAEINCLWITGTIGEAKIDSDKPEKQLKEFGFCIEEEYVTQVTEVLTERSGRIILWYNIPEPDEFYDEEEDPDEEDGDDSEEESDDEK